MGLFRRVVRLLMVVLGLFEMVMVYRLFTEKELVHKDASFFPKEFFELPGRHLLAIFTFLLGLIRIVWGVGNNTLFAWIAITFAHLGECLFLWTMASLPHFNVGHDALIDLIKKVASVRVGNVNSTVVLFVVPLLVILLVLHGPGDSRSSKKKTK